MDFPGCEKCMHYRIRYGSPYCDKQECKMAAGSYSELRDKGVCAFPVSCSKFENDDIVAEIDSETHEVLYVHK